MKSKVKKYLFFALFFLGNTFMLRTVAQNFGETKEHKRMWRHWSKKSDAFNPNVKNGKSIHAQSKKDAKENKKVLKEQAKEIRKQKRKQKKHYKTGK
ncbi:MAG: hypothetical protein JST67_04680 [Bacteroidetes bacterium]|nr:hypothetical protein [Bacteroidota bacterium]